MQDRISSEIVSGLDHCDLRVASLDLNRISILAAVAKEFDVYTYLLLSPSIERRATIPRQVAHLFAMLIPGYTLKRTGQEIGERDHSTVIYSLRTAISIYDIDRKFRERVNFIRDQLGISESTFNLHLNRWRSQHD